MTRGPSLCVLLCVALAAACSDGIGPARTVTVTSVSPSSGPGTGGTAVVITGTNFPLTIDSVRVGAGRLGSVVRSSDSLLAGTTPPGIAAGAVDVTVYATDAGSGTCSGCFSYVVFARYSVTFLGAGFDSSRAVDINDSGTVVGQVWSAASGWRGRLWPASGAATDLGVLLPVALNNHGSVVGRLADADTTPALWESGVVGPLGGLTAMGITRAYATGIDDAREVALWTGRYDFFGSSGSVYLWRDDSPLWLADGICGLGGMNNRGDVAATTGPIGCQYVSGSGTRFAVVLSSAGRYSPPGEGRWSYAYALNDARRVVGTDGAWGPCLFGYGPLPFSPRAINNSSQIVGEGSLWQDGATASLTALGLDSGWTVSNATAVNERGQIAASGVNTATGARGAIRLDPVATAFGAAVGRQR